MVQAVQGVLLSCDPPLKEYIKWLDEQQPAAERFVVADLPGEPRLFIKPQHLELVQARVKDYLNSLRVTNPAEGPGRRA